MDCVCLSVRVCVSKCVFYGMCVVGLCAYVNQASRTLNRIFVLAIQALGKVELSTWETAVRFFYY